ncbi:AI-2E family transporter [bacterium]|nr:AI-2E family transporter [bacterium]
MIPAHPVISPVYRRILLSIFFIASLVIFLLIFPLISDLLVMLIVSIIITYVMKPGVAHFEHLGVPRVWAIAGVFVLTAVVIVVSLRFFIPVLIDQGFLLVAILKDIDFNAYYTSVVSWVDIRLPGFSDWVGMGQDQMQDWVGKFTSTVSAFLQQSTKLLAGAMNVLMLSAVVPMLIFFFLKDGSLFVKNLIEKVPNRFFEMSLSLVYRVDQQLGNYIRSILVESLVIGLMTWVSLEILGIKFAIVLGLINGLLNTIPFFGPLIAYFPIGLIVLITYDPPLVGLVWMIIILSAIQIFDNILAKPFLIGRSVDVHPATVLLVVLVGGRLAGALGMFIAIPAYKIIQVIVVDSYNHLKEYKII